MSGDTDSDTDSISDADQETPPPISTIADVSIIGKPIFSPEPFDMSKFTNSYPHRCGRRIGQRQTHTGKKQLNSISAYKQQLTAFIHQLFLLMTFL